MRISDWSSDVCSSDLVAARPDVYNHNLETVPRLYPTIRPGARYYASLRLLESVKRHDPSIFTKSGIMLGLGEERLEVHQVMDDMRSADIDFRSEEHTSDLQSLMRISYAVFCLKKKRTSNVL